MKIRRLFSLLLCAALMFSLAPLSVFAAVPQTLDLADGDIYITTPGDYTIKQTVTGWTDRTIQVNVSGTVNITLSGVRTDVTKRTEPNAQCAFLIKHGTVHLSLEGENRLRSGDYFAGLQNGENTLVINGPGILSATSSLSGAGIGGGNNGESGDIIINGGSVYAYSFSGAGIGGGQGARCSPASNEYTLINGGTVIAQTTFGACIGGGKGAHGYHIMFGGGSVVTTVVDPGFADPTIKLGNNIGSGAEAGLGGEYPTSSVNGYVVNPTLISGLDANRKMEISVASPNQYYGTKDVYSDANGNICLMLPSGPASVTVGSNTYTGTVVDHTSNVLTCATVKPDGIIDLSLGSVEITSTGYSQGGKTYPYRETGGYIAIQYTIYQSTTKKLGNTITVKSGMHSITLENLNIDVSATGNACAFYIERIDPSLLVELVISGVNTLKSGENRAGIENGENFLQISGSGTLTTQGGRNGAGIGGGNGSAGSNIIINGGTITAIGGDGGAGIGGGNGGRSSNIVILGGSVHATGANDIGGGATQPAVTPKKEASVNVYLVKKDSLSDTEKGYLAGISYNITDAKAIDGYYYLYLPRYSISYENVADATNNNVNIYTVLDSVILANAAKSGFQFDGWYDSSTGGNRITVIGPESVGDKTLYARWSPVPLGTAPTITTASLPGGTVDTAYNQTLAVIGDAPITWSLDGGSLPDSLTLSSGGVISGTPTVTGTFNFTVKAENGVGSDTQGLSIEISPSTPTGTAPTITTASLPDGTVNTAYSQTLAADGDTPITWSLDSGSLPTGLTLSSGGTISGTPTVSGTFNFTVKATNNTGSDKKALSIVISPASNGDGGGGSTGGTNNSPSTHYVPNKNVIDNNDKVTVELSQGLTTLSSSQMNRLIELNRTKPVIIRGDGYTMTFPIGSLSIGGGSGEYDLGISFNSGENYAIIRSLTGNESILMVNFNHSGPLPGKTEIRFKVGTQYAGQKLYYYYYNSKTGQLEYIQEAVVGIDGYVTVIQSRCSQYVFLKTGPGSTTPSPGTPIPSVIAERIYGQSRYDTAVEIAKAYFANGADTVILTRGDISADALPAAPLAALYKALLLLTLPDSLPDVVFNEIKTLGTKKVIIIGGPGAIKTAVEERLKNIGLEVERIYGQTYYDTAYEIAKRLGGNTGQAILVNGDKYVDTFPDALSIAPWAAYYGVPILYANSNAGQLPEGTSKALTELGISKTLLIGGKAVIPESLEKLVLQPKRYDGIDLYGTNVEVLKQLQPNPEMVYVATGNDFADALAGAAVAGQRNSWLLLTGSAEGVHGLTAGQEELLKGVKGKVTEIHVFGGSAVVPGSTLEAVKALLGL